MFDIGWSEMAVIAVIALLIIGPKDLPRVLRVAGQWAGKARRVAREFQGNIEQLVRESEVDQIKKEAEEISRYDVKSELEQSIDPTGDLARAVDPSTIEEESATTDPADASPFTAPGSSPLASPDATADAESSSASPPTSSSAPSAEPVGAEAAEGDGDVPPPARQADG